MNNTLDSMRRTVKSLAKTYVALARTLREECRTVGLDPDTYAGPSQVTALFIESMRRGVLLPPEQPVRPERPPIELVSNNGR